MYSWSPNMNQISLKNSFGKVVFQIFAKMEMTQNESRSFGLHFEILNFRWYIFFCLNMFFLAYNYIV